MNFWRRNTICRRTPIVAILLATVIAASAASQSPKQIAGIVGEIRHADYAGDRAQLQALHDRLRVRTAKDKLAARVLYWRGFALWRRAINGFNDGVKRPELQQDLQAGKDEFEQAARIDPNSADAKIGELGCLSLIGYIQIENGAQMADPEVQKLFTEMRRIRSEAEKLDSENPRLLWVMGPNVWKSPPERGGGEAKALEMYQKGLEVVRRRRGEDKDPLAPSWGEPELLMNLAYMNLNGTKPDLEAAEKYANEALALVPYWHYVRDILKPQIEAKKRP